jgi:lactate dehydrogenase-like 2-hydroxyacid dehydrogenase
MSTVRKPRLVVTLRLPDAALARIGRDFDALLPPDNGLDGSAAAAAVAAHHADALLFSARTRLDAATIARMSPALKIAATCSIGVDHIDLTAARARGLAVTSTPGISTDCVADFAFFLILAASRRAADYLRIMDEGWTRRFGYADLLGSSVAGKTLGIVGMGRIGRAVARRARGFDMRVLYTDRARLAPDLEQGAEFRPGLAELLPDCDILTLHAPGGPDSDRMLNAETLALLPRGAVLVNTARGGLVDEDALIDALASGRLGAAGLDVFRREPDFDRRLIGLPNVFLTPHMASATVESRTAQVFRALDNIAAVCAGRPALDPAWS